LLIYVPQRAALSVDLIGGEKVAVGLAANVGRRATVRDVAAEAGVSLATVDRVLNERAGVSPGMVARVKGVMDRLGFHRDIFAASLATSRAYRFQFVLPRGAKNTFLVNLRQQAEAAALRLSDQRIDIGFTDYSAFDVAELVAVLTHVEPQQCMGVAVVAIDVFAVREAIDNLMAAGVGVVTLVSDVTPSRRLHYIGVNDVAAGRVAGTLIGKFTRGRHGKAMPIVGAMTLRDHADRRVGFEQVVGREYQHLKVLPALEGRDDSTVTSGLVQELLATHPDLVAIYSIGAGNRGIIEAVETSGRQADIVVVAHELTRHSRRALISGTFDAVINQPAALEVEHAVRALKAFRDGDTAFVPPAVGIDIFLRDNLP
jgi:LacI family transcriptional regulator